VCQCHALYILSCRLQKNLMSINEMKGGPQNLCLSAKLQVICKTTGYLQNHRLAAKP
jgi:hypothetical protein